MSTSPGRQGTSQDRTAASRRLAYILRHSPGSVGLELEDGGWVSIAGLLGALAAHGAPLSREQLDELVHTSGKRRFAYDETGTRVRASQGHSVSVDLGLSPACPPPVLFHGTVASRVASIEVHGLLPGGRQHVHLSATRELAEVVGARRAGPTVVFEVDAAALHADGHPLYLAENGVWLTAHVPPAYLTRSSG